MQQGPATLNGIPLPLQPQLKPVAVASFPSSPFSATIPVQTAILPVTVPISTTKPVTTPISVAHPTTPKTYPPPTTASHSKTQQSNGIKVQPASTRVTPPSLQPAVNAAVPRTQYPTPFTTPVKVPPNLVKTPQTTPSSPAKPLTTTQTNNGNFKPLASPALAASPISTSAIHSPLQSYTVQQNFPQPSTTSYSSPLRTSYTPPSHSPHLSTNTSPLAKSLPALSSISAAPSSLLSSSSSFPAPSSSFSTPASSSFPTPSPTPTSSNTQSPAKKTHIVSGLVSDLRKQAKSNKRKPDDSNTAKPVRVRKKVAKATVTPLTTTEEQTLLARLQMLGSDTSPAVNRLKRKLTLREVARRNGREPFDIDARVTKMLESTTKTQQRVSNFFSREELSNFGAQTKKPANPPATAPPLFLSPQAPPTASPLLPIQVTPLSQTFPPQQPVLTLQSTLPPQSTQPALSIHVQSTPSAESTPYPPHAAAQTQLPNLQFPPQTQLPPQTQFPPHNSHFPFQTTQPTLQPHTQTASAIDMFTTNSVPPSTITPPTASSTYSVPPVPFPMTNTTISPIPISTTPPVSTALPILTTPSVAPPFTTPSVDLVSMPPTVTPMSTVSPTPLPSLISPSASSSDITSPTTTTTTTTTSTTTTTTTTTSTNNDVTDTKNNPIIIPDDKPPTSDTNSSATSVNNIHTINSVNNVSSKIFVQQQKLQSLTHLKAVKALPKSVQEAPRSFRSLLEGSDDLRDGLGQSLVSPYTLRTLKPYIWRDYTSKPRHLRLMRELMTHPRYVRARNEFGVMNAEFAENEDPSNFPIDYVYFRPWLLPQVNTFLCSYFWPGIDARECLEYPDFTVCVLYRNMLVGCGFMTPDAYIIYIAVRHGWRDSGIATFMLYHLSQVIKGKDLTLHVSATNPAMLLYQKFGFKPEEFIVNFYHQYYPDDSLECKHAYLLRLRR